MTTMYVNWGEAKVKLTWKPAEIYPQRNLITSVHGFCFYKNQLLLVNLDHRGWDFPGGHIETNETPLECVKREVMEEGYVEGKCHFLGYIVVDHRENSKWKKIVHTQGSDINCFIIWILKKSIALLENMKHRRDFLSIQ